MTLADILTYTGILIAIWTLSPEYFRLKLKLVPFLYKAIFGISLLAIYVLSFEIIKEFVLGTGILNFKYFFYNCWSGWWEFALISIHFIFLILLLKLGNLRRGNQKLFYKMILELINNRNHIELFRMIEKNFGKLIKIRYKKTLLDKVLSKFDESNILVFIINDEILNKGGKLGRLQKIKQKIKQKINHIIGYILFDVLKLKYKENKYAQRTIELIIDKKTAMIIAEQNEMLGFKIIESFLKCKYKNKYGVLESENDLRYFCENFIINILTNADSLLSYEIRKEIPYSSKEIEEYNLKTLLKNSNIVGLEMCIDKAISNLLQEEYIKKALNEEYYESDYVRNRKIVLHIANLIDLFGRIDKEILVMSNTFIFLLKDFIQATDFKLESWNMIREWNSGTGYLIWHLFNICETINEETNFKYISIYYTMLKMLLENDFVIEGFKEKIVRSYFYFLFHGTEEQIKIKFDNNGIESFPEKSLKGLLSHSPSFGKYFKLDVHDKITHNLFGKGIYKQINDFIDKL